MLYNIVIINWRYYLLRYLLQLMLMNHLALPRAPRAAPRPGRAVAPCTVARGRSRRFFFIKCYINKTDVSRAVINIDFSGRKRPLLNNYLQHSYCSINTTNIKMNKAEMHGTSRGLALPYVWV